MLQPLSVVMRLPPEASTTGTAPAFETAQFPARHCSYGRWIVAGDSVAECALDGCATWRELAGVRPAAGEHTVAITPVELYARRSGRCLTAPTTFLFARSDGSRTLSAYSSSFYLPQRRRGCGLAGSP